MIPEVLQVQAITQAQVTHHQAVVQVAVTVVVHHLAVHQAEALVVVQVAALAVAEVPDTEDKQNN